MIALLLGVGVLLAAPGKNDGRAYALVIGNNSAPPGTDLAHLRYADDDGIRYYRLFRRMGADVVLLSTLDEETQRRHQGMATNTLRPTTENLLRQVAEFRKKMAADQAAGRTSRFYFAFSGHGAAAGNGTPYLVLEHGRLTRKMLYEQVLADLPAQYSHVFVDACNAGAVVGIRGQELEARTASVAKEEAEALVPSVVDLPNVGVIIATTIGQEAHEWSRIESGVFTHQLISALLGAADVNSDRVIEYSEVDAFVASANRDIQDPRATATVIAKPPRSNVHAPLTALQSHSPAAILTGQPKTIGHFYVELENGLRLLDAHPDEDQRIALALPADEGPVFVRTREKEAVIEVSGGEEILFSSLTFRDLQATARGSIDTSYRQHLFASAYGPTYYKGYVDSTRSIGVQFEQLRSQSSMEGGSEALAFTLLGGSVAAGLVMGVTGALAYKARVDYERTSFMQIAEDAEGRHRLHSTLALTTASVSVVLGVLTWLLWPEGS